MDGRLLSICIPTYNRASRVTALVKRILECESQEFLVEITDNASTDNTVRELSSISDERVVLYRNEANQGGRFNMIQAVFHVKSRYALFCTDRDMIYPDRIIPLIEVLRNADFAFAAVTGNKKSRSEGPARTKIIKKGLDSLIYHGFACHPTGILFHCEIIRKKKFAMEDYVRWGGAEPYCRLGWDLMFYGKTALIDAGIWRYAPKEFYRDNRSGYDTGNNGCCKKLYFHPYDRTKNMVLAMDYLLSESRYKECLSLEERERLAAEIATQFYNLLKYYKYNVSSVFETAHYGIKRRFITTGKLLDLCKKYEDAAVRAMERNHIGYRAIAQWKKKHYQRAGKTVIRSLLYDLLFLKHLIAGGEW